MCLKDKQGIKAMPRFRLLYSENPISHLLVKTWCPGNSQKLHSKVLYYYYFTTWVTAHRNYNVFTFLKQKYEFSKLICELSSLMPLDRCDSFTRLNVTFRPFRFLFVFCLFVCSFVCFFKNMFSRSPWLNIMKQRVSSTKICFPLS